MQNYGKIVVFAGGPSSEREISLKSGRAVCEALKRKKQDVELVNVEGTSWAKPKKDSDIIVFIALHGRFGEDGTIQALLEKMSLSYTGSGVEASRLALDKIASRELFLKNGLKVPAYKIMKEPSGKKDLFDEFKIPFVVKPQFEGSSIGLSVVRERISALEALKAAFACGGAVIVEEYIHGRELTVGIMGRKALPVLEIVTAGDVYDFNAKYTDGRTKYIVPAELDKDDYRRIQECAERAHNALGCRDFSRVDMRMDRRGNIYVLEVNTIPGLTERSLLPKAAGAAGVSFEDLCMKVVSMAHERKLHKGVMSGKEKVNQKNK